MAKPSTLRPVLVLVAICAVSGVLLGAVHQQTQPIIEAAEVREAEQTYAALLPGVSTFESLDVTAPGCIAAMRAHGKDGDTMGYVIVASQKGYGGDVPLAVAFDGNGVVMNVATMPNDETPGLGSKASDESYLSQYVGLEARPASAESIDLISGATITSTAVLEAFNHAVEGYQEVCA